MEFELITIILLSIVFFIAGFIDSIAGGGGLLTIPALLFTGIPPQSVLGTSKFASSFGTGMAVYNFARKKTIIWKVVAFGILYSLIGSFIGSKTILNINPDIVGRIIIFMLPIGIIATLLPKKQNEDKDNSLNKKDFIIKIPIICILIGFYDGFFGPGTGSFLTLFLYFFTNMSLLNATANSKVFNLISNVCSLTAFLFSSKVIFFLGFPLAISNIAGNHLGSKLAIKKGEKTIRIFLFIVLIIILLSLIYKYFI